MNETPTQGKGISLTAAVVDLSSKEGLSIYACRLLSCLATKAERQGVLNVKMSRAEADSYAGLSRRRLDKALDEIVDLEWIKVDIVKRRSTEFTFRLEAINANLCTHSDPSFVHLCTHSDPRWMEKLNGANLGSPGVQVSSMRLGTPDDPRWEMRLKSEILEMIQDHIPKLVRQAIQDPNAPDVQTCTPGDPSLDETCTPDDPRTVASYTRATAAASNLNIESGSRAYEEAIEKEMIREHTVARVTAESLDQWILESAQQFGRSIGIKAACGLSVHLMGIMKSAELAKEYVFERLIEHEAGDKRSGDKGFTSYLMRDAPRWYEERINNQQRIMNNPKGWGGQGFVTIEDDKDDEELTFENPFEGVNHD